MITNSTLQLHKTPGHNARAGSDQSKRGELRPKAGRALRAEPAETDVAAEMGQDQKSQNIITRYVTDWHEG